MNRKFTFFQKPCPLTAVFHAFSFKESRSEPRRLSFLAHNESKLPIFRFPTLLASATLLLTAGPLTAQTVTFEQNGNGQFLDKSTDGDSHYERDSDGPWRGHNDPGRLFLHRHRRGGDGQDGVYFYDFKSGTFFYMSPSFPFPYLYDFSLNSVVYYFPDPSNPGHYNTNGYRFFYVFSTDQIITK